MSGSRLRSVLWLLALLWPLRHASAAGTMHPEIGVGDWIWDTQTSDRQVCHFVRTFEIPKSAQVESAILRITADNSYQCFLDGEQIGQGGDWRVLIEYDLHLLLTPGSHVLAVSATNDFDVAGLLVGLNVKSSDGRTIEVPSDVSWWVVPDTLTEWKTPGRSRDGWHHAIVTLAFDTSKYTQVYQAPISQPVVTTLWQRPWFQVSMLVLVGASLATGAFLASRLLLQTQAERIVRRERTRLAGDLHDNLGGGLTRLVLMGESSRQALPADSPGVAALGRLCEHSRELIRTMNESVWLINSQRDTFRDLASYVARYAETFFQDSPIRCRFDVDSEVPPLPCDIGVRRNLFLAVKEALTNALRHSDATQVHVTIQRRRPGTLLVSIRDDGRGFDPSTPSTGNGLSNLRHRATEAGGSVTVRSAPGQGTTIEFVVPLAAPSHVKGMRSALGRLLGR